MTVTEAIERIKAALDVADASIVCEGLVKKQKIFFTDKNLSERADFSEDCILIFGDIKIGTPEMEEDDSADYSICAEIKTGLVSEEELDGEISAFESEIEAFKAALATASSAEAAIKEISDRQAQEAEKAAEEFQLEMKKMKLKLYLALGVGLAIIALVLIGGWLLR